MSGRPWLHKAVEWSGEWWLPSNPEDKRPGVLRYHPDSGVALSLIGGYSEKDLLPGNDPYSAIEVIAPRDWSVVLGFASNRPVTLLDCLPTNTRSYIWGEPVTQLVEAKTALVGVHLTGEDETVFTGCTASIECLTDWSGGLPFKGSVRVEGDKLRGGVLETDPLNARTTKYGDLALRLTHFYTTPGFERRRGHTVARMTNEAVLGVAPDEPASMIELSDVVHAVRDLVSLGTHRAAGLLWLTLALPPTERPDLPGSPIVPHEVEVYAQQTVRGDPDAEVPFHGSLFTCADLPFESVVPRWLEIRAQFAATCNLILGLRYLPGGYLETQLSSAVTAAEAMHQALELPPPISPDEFKALRKAAVGAVPKERQHWLRSVLARNDPSLRTRLLELADRPDQEAMETLLPDRHWWAKKTVAARNNLFHAGLSPEHTVPELYAIARVTTAVVLLNLLHEVGLSGPQQRSVLANNTDLSTSARLSRKHLVENPAKG